MGNEQSDGPKLKEDLLAELASSHGSSHSSSSSSGSVSSDDEEMKDAHGDRRGGRRKKDAREEEEEEEDEWLQGTPAISKGGGGGGGGGKKKGGKKGKKKGGGGSKKGVASAPTAAPPGSPEKKKKIRDPQIGGGASASASTTTMSSSSGSSPGGEEEKQGASRSTFTSVATQRERSTSCPGANKTVRWGEVVVQTFQRKPSQDAVPASGAWPLGFGEEEGKELTTVDSYEHQKHEEIEKRIQSLPKRLRKIATGETRQYDYKSSREKNPIFGPVDERGRKQALLQALEHTSPEDEEALLLSSSPRTAAGGIAHPHNLAHMSKYSALEEVEKARSLELDDIRRSRKRIGCSCSSTKAPDKLSLKKLKEELHRRHLSAPGTDKAKLAEHLKEVLSKERLCSDEGPDECECFVAGVPCHADVCGCCASGSGKGGGGGKHHQECRNPGGNFCYLEASVRGHRFRFLTEKKGEGGGEGQRPRSCSI